MTNEELTIAKCLVAVAWADGTVKEPERALLDGLAWAFGANDEQEAALMDYAQKKRTLAEAPIEELSAPARELCLAHAALLTHADGKQTKAEEKLLKDLCQRLGFDSARAKPIIDSARQRASRLATRV